MSGQFLELYQFKNRFLYGVSGRPRKPRQRSKFHQITDSNVHATRSRLRRILQSNGYQYFNNNTTLFVPIFITFTFAENITSLTIAHEFWKNFIKRLNYYVYNKKCSELRYLVVPEFQKRGAVHYHCIFFNLPFIDKIYDEVRNLWGQGFILVKTIKDLTHLVNYVSKYFTKESLDSRLVGRKKYFTSRGLKKSYVNYEPLLKGAFLKAIENQKPVIAFSYVQDYTQNDVEYARYANINLETLKFLSNEKLA